MYPDKPEEMREWIDALQAGIEKAKLKGKSGSSAISSVHSEELKKNQFASDSKSKFVSSCGSRQKRFATHAS